MFPLGPTRPDLKIQGHLTWNYAALGVMGVSGVAINLIIAQNYGAGGLGIFNLVYVVYAVAAQFAGFGLHHSVLTYTAEHYQNRQYSRVVGWTGAVLALAFGSITSVLGMLFAPYVGWIFDSPITGTSIGLATLAFPFFALNKVLLASLNGLRLMARYAVWQIFRYILLVAAAITFALLERPIEEIGLIFLAAELPLSIALTADLARQVGLPKLSADTGWYRRHISFGFRGLLGGFLMELNFRSDIILLGIFTSDTVVGLYSFVAMLGEAFLLFLGAVRTVINPIMVPMLMQRQFSEIRLLARMVQRRLYPASLCVAIAIGTAYPLVVAFCFGNESEFINGWGPLLMLLVGIFLVSGFIPFNTMLVQGGKPGTQTKLGIAVFTTNISLNILLIPIFGMLGAATATATTLVFSILYLNIASRLALGSGLGLPIFTAGKN